MKTKWPAIGLACVLLASGSLLANRVSATPDPTTPAVRVTAKITPESVRITARSTAPFTYSTSRPSDRLIVIDLPGAVAAEASHSQTLSRANVGSYRLVPYTKGSTSGLRLEVSLSGPAQPRFERTSNDELDLVFDTPNGVVSPAAVTPVSARQPAILHGAPARISHVSVSAQGQQPGVQIEGTGDFHYRATRMDNPTRLVLDFADTTLVNSTSTISGDSNLIRNIRLGQFQADVARVVIELERWSPYTVTTSSKGLTVTFGSSSNSSDLHTASLRAGKSAPVAPELPLPTWLTQPTFGFASQSPSAPPAPAPSQQSQTMATSAQGMTPSGSGQMSPKYSGEPIRVNFKDVDLQDFFRLIHEVSGLNVVLDPSVKGSVTLVMEDVPWDQVLDIVLRNNNLDKQLDGNVLRIASRSTIKAEADQKAALILAEANSEPIITVTRRLSYAKATTQGVAQAAGGKQQQGKGMDELLKPFLSTRGSVFGDPRTNTLIVRDIQSTIPKIDDLIKQLDRKSQQVEIEARVVLASRSFAQDIGTQIALAGANGGNVLGGAQQVGTSPFGHGTPGSPSGTIPPLVSAGTTSMPLLTNLGATAATSGLSFEHIAGSFAIDMIITAMESKGVGKLLSAPKVVTQNNSEGLVQQGTQIPIQTNINNTISTQYIAAVLMLKVTPQITADGTIFMIIHIENTQIDSGIPAILGQPALSTQSVDDQVLAKDGETVMLGGVMVNSQTTQYNEVPLFGSIPVIGNLFKHRTISVQSQELWFFLTPRVTPD